MFTVIHFDPTIDPNNAWIVDYVQDTEQAARDFIAEVQSENPDCEFIVLERI